MSEECSIPDAGSYAANTPNSSDVSAVTKSRPVFSPDDLYYNMSGDRYIYIFNHYAYQKTRYFNQHRPSTREGTQKDVNRLSKVFSRLGFKVVAHNDLEHGDIIKEVTAISSRDHSNTSCLFFAFLTHGERGGDLYASDRPYQFRDVLVLLEHGHASLVAKPKVLFVQACRGDQKDEGRRVELDSPVASYVVPTHADFLILYSTVEDYLSYRDTNGSFMIQDLCNIIESYHESCDLLHLITLVHHRVAYHRSTYAPKSTHHNKKQMPETRFSLTKLLKL
ncbi:caspase-1-like [Leptidea sinapis]|uniref:caspase-1-like n=1 Tax=Leptidea sinapis TaxID=189913 RepID=UPI0021441C2C|nr:caspase-1-like [Leptidea sinapis]